MVKGNVNWYNNMKGGKVENPCIHMAATGEFFSSNSSRVRLRRDATQYGVKRKNARLLEFISSDLTTRTRTNERRVSKVANAFRTKVWTRLPRYATYKSTECYTKTYCFLKGFQMSFTVINTFYRVSLFFVSGVEYIPKE